MKKNVAIIQVRTNSSRFPKKSIKKIDTHSLIEWVVKRVKKSKKLDLVVIATSKRKSDKIFGKIAKKLKVKIFYGDENNVLSRYCLAAKKFKAQNIIRVCADNPFISHNFIDNLIYFFNKNKCDLAFNHRPLKKFNYRCINGLGAEIVSRRILEEMNISTKSNKDKEHVTRYLYNNYKYLKKPVPVKKIFQINKKLDIDKKEDFLKIKKFIKKNNLNINSNDYDIIKALKNE